ncbi:Protein of unknown function DUF1635 [Macleaya cordata]|uniref:TOX high mobility group box family member 4-A n=1 Tax=Macleaya cordata TaxID=56857 RepID=A0A200R6C1_MACCD|nr:Protein of unknown function DUF1635 [Macleaya cordata]
MEEMSSVWSYQENVDQLKKLLLYTTFELESARTESREEINKIKENTNQLVQLLKETCRERDEARDQLQRLLNKFTPSSPPEIFPVLSSLQPITIPVNSTKGNSSITESDSLSETYNHHSYGSPPVDSFFDTVSSPDLSNVNMGDSSYVQLPHQPFIQERNGCISVGTDHASMIIENLVKGKILPQKGKLLQSVMEAGPLLQTLLLAGPLPRWRNPPPVQPLQLPPLSINGSEPVQNSSSLSYSDISHGSSQIYSTSMLNFSSGSGTCLNKGQVLSAGPSRSFVNNLVPAGKRQRFQ